jgi:TRAP-type uncharacterized transport system substrate-binding protein
MDRLGVWGDRSMGDWGRGIVFRVLAATICVIAAVWLALWYFIPAPPTTITIAAGIKNGAFDHIAELYRERLARHHVTLDVRFTAGAVENVGLINDPKSGVAAALLFMGATDGARSPELVSLGRINYAPFWIFYKGSETLDRLTQLKGKRINVPPVIRPVANQVLNAHGITAENTTMLATVGPIGVKSLRDGEVDATFLPPIDMGSPLVQGLLRDPSVRLMNLAQADTITRLFPYLHKVILTQGVVDLEKNIPSTDVNLVASTDVVVVRSDLHPELKLLLARTLQEVHGSAGIFQRAGEFPTQIDPEFPMAEEVLDFYRNGPSFLQRYLPFWMINYAKRVAAILVAAVAIVIPLFTYGPKLYDWLLQSQLRRLYRRLRVVEDKMLDDLTAPQVAALQGDVDGISRAARILPLRHSDLFFPLIMHIDLVRTRLAGRLVGLRGERAA